MLVDPGKMAVGSAVTGAIRQASQATGTSFSYLLATAQVESGLNPRAGASTSSARGLFQFVSQTWLGTMKQAGAALGYGRYAAAITKTASGHFEVQDPVMRNEILKLRNDPTANALMAGAFTKTNAAYLTQTLGRAPSDGELYIAHFLGAGGAAQLISLAARDPNAKAAAYFPNAASANPSIFYDRRTGTTRTVAQVRDMLVGRFDVARAQPDPPAPASGPTVLQAELPEPVSAVPAVQAANRSAAASPPVPDTAAMANVFAAAVVPTPAHRDGQIFHGLFQDIPNGGGAVDIVPTRSIGSVVGQLWSIPTGAGAGVAPGASAPAPTDAVGNLLDLFQDPVRRS